MHLALQKAVTKMLAPLVRVLLRHGVSHGDFSSWAKQAYVEEANRNFGIGNKKPTVSRLAIVTGINRKEVKRILELPSDVSPGISKHNRAIRVVTGWLQDHEFNSAEGEPLPLNYGDVNSAFSQLVRRYGGDVPARAVLDELVRVGTVSINENLVTLARKGYVPHESEEAMLTLFSTSARDLLTTLDHNVSGEGLSRLQMSVAYDNVSEENLRTFQKISNEKALALLRELDSTLATFDRGSESVSDSSDRFRTGLGIYFIEEPFEGKQNNEN